MPLQLYGNQFSTCTRRVLITLKEKGVEAEFNNIELAKGEQRAAKYVNELQPFGKVPVLIDQDAGVQIFESRAIAQYIAAKYRNQGAEVAPSESDMKKYALYQQALSIEQAYFDPPVSTLVFEKVFKARKGLGQTDEAVCQKKLQEIDTALQGYERILSKQDYLAGSEVTLADLFHLPYGVMAEQFGFKEIVAKYPAVSKWWDRLKARQSWKEITA